MPDISMASLQFVTPLMPAIRGASSQFAGLALTPDGSELLAANTLDGSLAVINPDSPSSTYAIPIAGFSGENNCAVGPLYVAATSSGQAFVITGSIPSIAGCPSQGNVYIANIAAKTAAGTSGVAACSLFEQYPFTTSLGVDATLDGSLVVLGSGSYGPECLYSVASNSYSQVAGSIQGLGVTISPDGNIVGSGVVLDDASGRLVGRLSHPVVFYGTGFLLDSEDTFPAGALFNPRLNDAGSLYFWPFPNYFEIVDVPTGRLRLRFSLVETVQNAVTPLALDGTHDVFLITDKGLTVVDLGSALLSVGPEFLNRHPRNTGRDSWKRFRGWDDCDSWRTTRHTHIYRREYDHADCPITAFRGSRPVVDESGWINLHPTERYHDTLKTQSAKFRALLR